MVKHADSAAYWELKGFKSGYLALIGQESQREQWSSPVWNNRVIPMLVRRKRKKSENKRTVMWRCWRKGVDDGADGGSRRGGGGWRTEHRLHPSVTYYCNKPKDFSKPNLLGPIIAQRAAVQTDRSGCAAPRSGNCISDCSRRWLNNRWIMTFNRGRCRLVWLCNY